MALRLFILGLSEARLTFPLGGPKKRGRSPPLPPGHSRGEVGESVAPRDIENRKDTTFLVFSKFPAAGNVYEQPLPHSEGTRLGADERNVPRCHGKFPKYFKAQR